MTPSRPPARLVSAAAIAPERLQTLVEACFAGRPRPPGWFARKLVREAVDLERSLLAFGPGDELLGYTLTGAEPGATLAHSAGLGVLPAWRRRGIGSALLRALHPPLRRAGISALRVLAEPPLRRFYARLDFHAQAERHTLWAPGTGRVALDLRAHPRRPWALPGQAVAGWREGTWTRTPDADAATLQLVSGAAWVHLSREGPALLIQRLCVADEQAIHPALTQLRAQIHADTALLLYGCDIVSCITASLIRAKWRVAQTACEMQRELDIVDKAAPPAA